MPYTRHFRILYPAVLGLAAALSVGGAASASAAEATVAVSPGSTTGTVIGDACPTFSWGAVSGAESYEVVVYRVQDDEREAVQPVLRQTFAGSASSWTPSLDRCLERGQQYAWSVRSVGKEGPAAWSSPSLFEVAGGPSEAELEEALAVVKSYLETGGSGVALAGEVGGAEAQAGPTARVSAQPNQGETSAGRATGPSSPQPSALSNVQLTVDGDVMATAFGGDGSNLTGVIPAGAIVFFFTRSTPVCPEGWEYFPDLAGRYVVGGQDRAVDQEGVTVGFQLTINPVTQENRIVGAHGHAAGFTGAHNHTLADHHYSDVATQPPPGGNLADHQTPNGDDAGGIATVANTTSDVGAHQHQISTSGIVPGTNAPYIILSPCKKI